jgi:hypothetical protein
MCVLLSHSTSAEKIPGYMNIDTDVINRYQV